ncbi:MAG: efflux RND transporter periplasmic adaptor subunit [Candidatus Omnitrophica bacterium]|nr:efflux RND transporter periplasmic adaptor subunit [Candidatus Omnitrophota bacterium]
MNHSSKCRVSYYYIGISILLFGVMGCQQQKNVTQSTKEAIPVEVVMVAPMDISEVIEYVGNIKAQDEIQVYPKVTGKVIEKVKQEGERINKGEAVVLLDRDEVGLTFEKAPVESPLGGFVGRVYVDIGSNVTPQTPVALVVNMQTVKIRLDVPEKYIPRLSLGQKAKIKVDAYQAEEFSGTVTKISPVIDQISRTAPIEIVVENQDHRLRSGMFARVELILATRLAVPVIFKEAIVGQNATVSVYVVEGRKAVMRAVTLGLRQGPYYEVTSGLAAGDMVVVIGQQRLFDGAEVIAEERK